MQHVLQHALGMEAVAMVTFLGTVRCMFPVVKGMLDEMCELAKQEMKALPTLRHALGIKAVNERVFMRTIELMYPVLKVMLDEVCEIAKQEMKEKCEDELGSCDHCRWHVANTRVA